MAIVRGSRIPPRTPPTLNLPRDSLVTVAKCLVRAATQKRVLKAELVLRHDDGHLTLEVLGGGDGVPATGHWPGALHVPGMALILFSKGELPTDPVQLSYSDGYLHIRGGGAHIKFKGHWQDTSATRIDIPLDATDRDYLRLSLTHSPAEITCSGLDKQIAAAEKRLQKKLDKAHHFFAPLGLTRGELDALIRSALLRRME